MFLYLESFYWKTSHTKWRAKQIVNISPIGIQPGTRIIYIFTRIVSRAVSTIIHRILILHIDHWLQRLPWPWYGMVLSARIRQTHIFINGFRHTLWDIPFDDITHQWERGDPPSITFIQHNIRITVWLDMRTCRFTGVAFLREDKWSPLAK